MLLDQLARQRAIYPTSERGAVERAGLSRNFFTVLEQDQSRYRSNAET